MSDPRPADEEELISRVLDGDATAVDRARVAGDVRLQARLRDFERVRAAIADIAAPTAAVRDAAITAAIAEAAPVVADDGGVSTDRPDHTRGLRRRHVATVVAVAAALLIGLPLLAIVLTGRGTEQKSASTAGLESAADAPTDTGAPLVEGAGATSGYAGDLGPIDNGAQLQAAVALAITAASASNDAATSQLAQPTPTADASAAARSSSSTPDPTPACINQLATSDPTLGAAVLTATATWQGEPALVVVYRGATDTIVVVRDGCTVVARLPA